MRSLHPVTGGITAPAGFRASGLHCGIKASGKPDLALLVSDLPAYCRGRLHDQPGQGRARCS